MGRTARPCPLLPSSVAVAAQGSTQALFDLSRAGLSSRSHSDRLLKPVHLDPGLAESLCYARPVTATVASTAAAPLLSEFGA